jgi:hypothetical protein
MAIGHQHQHDHDAERRMLMAITLVVGFLDAFRRCSTEPGPPDAEFERTDEEERPPGLNWYDVRVQQDDRPLAWGSPIWVHFGDAAQRWPRPGVGLERPT